MKIFLDIGNTFVKTAEYHSGKLRDSFKVTSNQFIKDPQKYLSIYDPADSIVFVSSVLGKSSNTVLAQKLEEHQFSFKFIQVSGELNGFKTVYDPEALGVDRWLACLAANQIYQQNVIVVDAGTAITIDLVTKTGIHLGGYIAAGLGKLDQKIKASTSLEFKNLSFAMSHSVPTDTSDALKLGNSLMLVGFLKQIQEIVNYNHFTPSLGGEVKWVLTGGDCGIISNCLDASFSINKQLVLMGALIFSEHFE